jgi:hypothetical protein
MVGENDVPSLATVTATRHVLVHHHIFKNAGSTIDWILHRAFATGYLDHEDAAAVGLLDTRAVLQYLRQHSEIRAFSRHHLPFATMKVDGFAFLDIVLVRHPIDRLRSVYDFYRRQADALDVIGRSAKAMGLGVFLRHLMERWPNQVNDAQVTMIANGGYYARPPSRSDLQRASAVLEEAALAGTVESFDDSMISAEYYLAPTFSELNLAYMVQNVSEARLPTLDDRLAMVREQCGQRCYARLLALNELDIELAQVAEAEVSRRLALVPSLDTRRKDFQRRCAEVAAENC